MISYISILLISCTSLIDIPGAASPNSVSSPRVTRVSCAHARALRVPASQLEHFAALAIPPPPPPAGCLPRASRCRSDGASGSSPPGGCGGSPSPTQATPPTCSLPRSHSSPSPPTSASTDIVAPAGSLGGKSVGTWTREEAGKAASATMYEEVIRQRDIELEGKDDRIRTLLADADDLLSRLRSAETLAADADARAAKAEARAAAAEARLAEQARRTMMAAQLFLLLLLAALAVAVSRWTLVSVAATTPVQPPNRPTWR